MCVCCSCTTHPPTPPGRPPYKYNAHHFGCHLQKAQKKMLDVINSVGLSSSVLKMIERRHKNDLYLALGGMVSERVTLWGGGGRRCGGW